MPTINPVLPNDGEDADAIDVSGPILAILSVLNGHVDEDNLEDGAVLFTKLASAVANALVPTGTILAYGGATTPNSDWLLCYGQAVSRSTYSSLYAILGDLYGVGNGTTTFNLPDFRGRVPVGNDAMGGTAANRIQRTSTITTTNGSPTGTVGSATGLSVGMTIVSTNVPANTTITAITGTTVTMSANATGAGTNVAARFSMVGDAQVLGKAGGADVHQLTAAQIAAHTHVVSSAFTAVPTASPTANVWNGSVGSSFSITSGTNVGDQAHPNMQPSQLTNFIIKV